MENSNNQNSSLPAVVVKKRPVVCWYKSGDPTKNYKWVAKLEDINIIQTKVLTEEFIKIVLVEKHRIFLHIVITGMAQTMFEPNIPAVKDMFFMMQKLIDRGFPQKQILVVVNPIVPNENGLKSLELLLRVFTEFKPLRLRFIRFTTMRYRQLEDSGTHAKFTIANDNILARPAIKGVMMYLTRASNFTKDYFNLVDRYKSIITVDNGEEQLIGIRELMAFGYKNEWIEPNGERTKLIEYEKNNKYKPIVKIISNKFAVRCSNRCLLCAHKY